MKKTMLFSLVLALVIAMTGIVSAKEFNITVLDANLTEFGIPVKDNLEAIVGIGLFFDKQSNGYESSELDLKAGGRYYLDTDGKVNTFVFGNATLPFSNKTTNTFSLAGGFGFSLNVTDDWSLIAQTGVGYTHIKYKDDVTRNTIKTFADFGFKYYFN